MKNSLDFVATHFNLVMLALSIIIAFAKNGNFFNRLTNSMLFFSVGISGIWGFVQQTVFAESTSAFIGYSVSPFQSQVASANLAIGIMAILSLICSRGYKKATATFLLIFNFGKTISYIHQIITMHNYHPSNYGAVLYIDIAISIILWIALLNHKPKNNNREYI